MSGLCQALIALMPPHAVYVETHLGGDAVMRRKPAALRSIIGIDLDARALASFECGHPVELVHGDCHAYLSEFAFDGSELVYGDPPYLRGARKSRSPMAAGPAAARHAPTVRAPPNRHRIPGVPSWTALVDLLATGGTPHSRPDTPRPTPPPTKTNHPNRRERSARPKMSTAG